VSERLPAVKPKQLVRVLEQRGWYLDRIRGSHHIMKHPVERRSIPVPVHSRDLAPGTLRATSRTLASAARSFVVSSSAHFVYRLAT
jgi:predicted RNA binding protein YcfA (HicA-like mRNA interferase family)